MPISVKAQFERRKLDKSKDHTGHLMVSLAGESKDFVRTPVSTILVLDVSGSMNGAAGPQSQYIGSSGVWAGGNNIGGWTCQPTYSWPTKTKLQALKETALKLVENLSACDEVGLVTFSDVAQVIYERRPLEDKWAVNAAINSMYTQGSTNMSGGLLQAFKMVNHHFKGVKRIILLTDGLANVGVSDPNGLLNVVDQREGTTISTFGFGMDCNRSLLEQIARAAGGTSYFIDNAEDLSNTFAKELGGMLSCIAQNVEVKITPNKGVSVDLVLNNFTVEDLQGTALIKAEDVYAGENKKILIKMKLNKVKRAKPRATSLAHIEVSYDDLVSKKRETMKLNAKVEYVKAAHADIELVLEVKEQVAIIEAAKAQKLAVTFADAGQYDLARNAINCSMVALQDAASSGSNLADQAYLMSSVTCDSFSADKYTRSIGASLSNDADNAMRHRVGTGGISKLYATQAQSDMVAKFGGTPEDKATVDPAVAKALEEAKKTFAKKRNQQ